MNNFSKTDKNHSFKNKIVFILLSKNKGISLVCIFPCFIQTDKYHILKIIIDIPLVHYHENCHTFSSLS